MPARPTRRQFLLGSAGALGVAGALGGGGLLVGQDDPAPPPQRIPDPPRRPSPTDAVSTVEWIRSTARGRAVRLVTVLPPDADRSGLPVCVALHGLRGNALWFGEAGNRRLLGDAWARGVPTFALVAVDGGDNYWHPYTRGDDPLRMLLEELPAWLRERGLATTPAPGDLPGEPAMATGVSMGGAGALLYTRERVRRQRPTRAVGVISPGLFTDWRAAARRPFRDRPDWEAHDPLRFCPELAGVPTGVWCGDADPFVEATRRYVALARPEVATIGPGRHDGVYYARVMPDVIGFLGRHARDQQPGAGPRRAG
ncbi:alpha/beta hydrolase [Actinomycetospora lemnae]|uniref:Acyl-CoA:diacylglycerol acyltransferase n=1 Tax=Actinomycetospora lemnae TaxID=3019891 RepID=A0ABT5SW00_9PSEU|nr:alpha/beta hydrolase-fold protein [Actinomycetospora sp. DW7H6]MDD7967016.1 alpha/beta hydrolase-fold protein [Actinomycetospora sp. DW7H6]